VNEASPGPQPLVLVVDDEPQIRRLLTVALESAGYRVLTAATGAEGLAMAANHRPALVLLDLGLPDIPGIETLRRLREWSDVPVVVVSVQDAEADKITALDLGADDFLTKPFNTGELLARIRVALRHAEKAPAEPVFQAGDVVVDLATRRVTRSGHEVSLTAKEYDLLRLMVRHAGKVLTHRHILREVWGPTAESQTHYLRVYLARLREKLEADPKSPALLLTEPGVGYRLVDG